MLQSQNMRDFVTADPPIENAGLIYNKEGTGSKGIYAVGSRTFFVMDGSQDLVAFFIADSNTNQPGIFELEVVIKADN